MEVLERHSELEFLHLKHELLLSPGGLEIDPVHRKIHYNNSEKQKIFKEVFDHLRGKSRYKYMNLSGKGADNA